MEQKQFIYILINPVNGEIFYVGCTTNPASRLLAHNTPRKKGYTSPKEEYVIKHNIKPEMKIVQVVTDGLGLNREKKWIKRLRKHGHPLTNAHMMEESDAYNRRYK